MLTNYKALPLLKTAYDCDINPVGRSHFVEKLEMFICYQWGFFQRALSGQTERITTKARKIYNIPRSKVVLMTNCYRVVRVSASKKSELFHFTRKKRADATAVQLGDAMVQP